MKETTARPTKPETGANETAANQTSVAGQDAETLLKADHRKVEGLFEKYKSLTSAQEKAECAKEISKELVIHSMLEEEILYPACREKQVESKLLDEAQVEHDGAKVMICELLGQNASAEYYDAKVTVLSEYIKHHVGEEEKRSEGIFAAAKKAGVDMDAVGQKIQSRKQELMQQMQGDNLDAPQFRSLQSVQSETYGNQETAMARYGNDRGRRGNGERDRDEQGRFMSDDDDRRYSGGRGSSRYGDDDRGYRSSSHDDDRYGRGNYGSSHRDRDEYGRFTSDDDRSGSGNYRGSGRGGEYGRGSSGYRERDESRRFMGDDDRGYTSGRGSGSRYRDDEEGYGRGQGRRFGGSEDYSRSGRFGQGSGRHDDDDDRGYSSSRRSSSRYRDEDDDRFYSSSGRSGGYGSGESSGGRERDEYGRFISDEDRGYSSSRRSSSRYRDDDENERSGQGQGWFGDSEGHARAARRGWRNRE